MAEFSKENPAAEEAKEPVSRNFIEQMIDKDLEEGVYETVHTRFPPEPNGYLHIGHAKSILLNYGLAKQYGGKFNLRFDDTNPTKEKIEFVESIKADVKWLGADWEDRLFFASNYFDQMYEGAVKLIQKGKAYVSDLSADQIREYRGTLTEPGKMDPGAERSVEENLALFEEMKAGKYADGEKVLRARIDMASPNMNMRDPVIYRVAHMTHHNTGDNGVSIRCTILHIPSRMPSRALPIPSVRWNLKITVRCTTGLCGSWNTNPIRPVRSSLQSCI